MLQDSLPPITIPINLSRSVSCAVICWIIHPHYLRRTKAHSRAGRSCSFSFKPDSTAADLCSGTPWVSRHCNLAVLSSLFYLVSPRWTKEVCWRGSLAILWVSWSAGHTRGTKMHSSTSVRPSNHNHLFKHFISPRFDFKPRIVLARCCLWAKLKWCMYSSPLGIAFWKYKFWIAWNSWENLIQDHINWPPVMLQLKTPQVSKRRTTSVSLMPQPIFIYRDRGFATERAFQDLSL